jgi:D-glycero-alpha-D-manno-heptose-7-phosphate kinase
LEECGITVIAAINLNSYVRIATRRDRRIILIAQDLNLVEQAESLEELEISGTMELVARAVKFYSPKQGLEITTASSVPKGSGLGASSSLLVSLSMALRYLTRKTLSKETVIDCSANLETQTIRIPAGRQDYYPPMYGGFNALWFGIAGARREKLPISAGFQQALQERLVLSFTGQSRFSGTSNWNMLKRYIDRTGNTVGQMKAIKATALALREALLSERLDDLGKLLSREWNNRKRLAAGVTNPRIDSLVRAAQKAGALSSKICGAGGGGCMITLVKPERRAAVERALSGAGATLLPYRFRPSGVRLLTAAD